MVASSMILFDRFEKFVAYALMGLMAIIVLSSTLEVAYEIISNLLTPPGFFIGVRDLFELFGLFMMVLIGLELMTSIRMYLEDHKIHAELMMLIAITAVTRKIVIMDAKKIDPMIVFAIAAMVVALTVGHYLMRRSRKESAQQQ